MVSEHWANDLLCMAARAGCKPIIERLVMDARDNKNLIRVSLEGRSSRSTESTHQSIGQAVLGNHVDVVEYLLRQPCIEVILRQPDLPGQNILHAAFRYCNPDILRLLVPRFTDGICQLDHEGRTPLELVQMSPATNRLESAKILSEGSAATGNDCHYDEQNNSLKETI